MGSERFLNGQVMLHCGDCREVLATLAENSLDACVTDPPYHLTVELRHTTKSLGLQMQNGRTAEQRAARAGFMGKCWDGGDVAFRPETWAAVYRVLKPGAHLVACGGTRTYHRLACAIEDAGFEIRDTVSWLYGQGFPKSLNVGNGWGTALKPACELIVLARKPLSESTIAANVLRWGTGAINVDGCRIRADEEDVTNYARSADAAVSKGIYGDSREQKTHQTTGQSIGRWPANVVHDGSDEVVAAFPESIARPVCADKIGKSGGGDSKRIFGMNGCVVTSGYADTETSAARFFYTAKADADDRLGSKHPTVKPLDLMQWLVRLVTPKGGLVLDLFAGTGTTGEAAWREGMSAVLIEREPEYQADIRRRMALVLAGPDERSRASIKAKGLPIDDGPLFARG